MDNDRFTCITYTDSLCFGILDNFCGHPKICFRINIYMAVPCTGFNYGHSGIFHYIAYKTGSPARNKNIYIFILFHKL